MINLLTKLYVFCIYVHFCIFSYKLNKFQIQITMCNNVTFLKRLNIPFHDFYTICKTAYRISRVGGFVSSFPCVQPSYNCGRRRSGKGRKPVINYGEGLKHCSLLSSPGAKWLGNTSSQPGKLFSSASTTYMNRIASVMHK